MLSRVLPQVGRDGKIIIAAAALRTLDYGFISVFLGVYLTLLEFSVVQAGMVFSAIMAGSALSNTLASWKGDTIGRKRMFIAMSVLMVAGGVAFSISSSFIALMLIGVFAVTTSGGGDRTAFISLDTAVLAQTTSPSQRTLAFSWYNLATIFTRSLGALLIALPVLIQRWSELNELDSYKAMFAVYAVIAVGGILLYAKLSPRVEVARDNTFVIRTKTVSEERSSRSVIWKMTGLSSLDALGGGFAVRSFVSFWFVNRFGVDLFGISGIFFVAQLLNVVSVALAAPVAKRVGLVNTMAFTQVAANLMFIGMAFSGNVWVAVAFFLLHEVCNDMDVPARQSYTMAIVPPESRTAMASLNNLGRNMAQTISPTLAGIIAQLAYLGAPFLVGALTKLVYNALLLQMFREIKPPEEL
jgi:MFS family permease